MSIDIGSQWELLADPSLVEQLIGSAAFRQHHPVPREIVENIRHPRDGVFRYMTVLHTGQEYRLYFGVLKVVYGAGGKTEREPEHIMMATSRDGLEWKLPELGIFEEKGARNNSIVWMEQGEERLGISGFSPFIDGNPACPPEERFKAIAELGPHGKKVIGRNGLVALCSPDGIRWRMMAREPIMIGGPGGGAFDSQNLAFWNAPRKEYRLYRREVFREEGAFRDVLTATSPDFLHWSDPVRLCYPGAHKEQLYTNGVQPYFRSPHLFLGMPVRYIERRWSAALEGLPELERRIDAIRRSGEEPGVEDPTGRCGQRMGTALTDVLLMTSRDGVTFHRRDEAFIRPGLRLADNWFYPDNFPAWGMASTRSSIEGAPDELSFYLTEGGRKQEISNHCRRYTLRIDGFVSINAGRDGGEMVTKPLRFKGDSLAVNFAASAAGSLRVEIQDEHGAALPGLALDQCIDLLGDDLERPVRWSGGANPGICAGRVVRLRFVLVDADLYAFGFQ